MADDSPILFSLRDVAEIMVRQKNIHEGIWGIYVEFGMGAANVQGKRPEGDLFPAAIVPVVKLGLQRFQKPSSLTVDAAEVNPPRAKKAKKAKKAKRKAT